MYSRSGPEISTPSLYASVLTLLYARQLEEGTLARIRYLKKGIKRRGYQGLKASSYCLQRMFLKDAPSLHSLQHVIGMVVTLGSCVSDSPDHLLRSVVALGG